MQSSNQPGKISLPFANSGAKQPIPVASQVGIEDGRASYTDGFPPLTRTPLAAGGKPPFGTDMNGILNAITAIQQWQSAGGLFMYDSAMSTASGGYPKGAFILKADASGLWQSLVENNTSNPDTGGAGWADFSISGIGIPAGGVQIFAMVTAPSGWLVANGSAVSRATYSRLFSAIGTTFGVGDGSTTFNLPDLRGEFVRGFDNGRGVNPGRVFGSSEAQQVSEHYHAVLSVGSGAVTVGAGNIATATVAGTSVAAGTAANANVMTSGVYGSTSAGAETRPRNVALLYCIKI